MGVSISTEVSTAVSSMGSCPSSSMPAPSTLSSGIASTGTVITLSSTARAASGWKNSTKFTTLGLATMSWGRSSSCSSVWTGAPSSRVSSVFSWSFTGLPEASLLSLVSLDAAEVSRLIWSIRSWKLEAPDLSLLPVWGRAVMPAAICCIC